MRYVVEAPGTAPGSDKHPVKSSAPSPGLPPASRTIAVKGAAVYAEIIGTGAQRGRRMPGTRLLGPGKGENHPV